MSKDLDEMLKESPTLTFEPFPEEKEEIQKQKQINATRSRRYQWVIC